MRNVVKGTRIAPPAAKRGKPHRASVEALNGGGYKTTLEHHGANPSEMYGSRPAPIEAAHKTYKNARKAMDTHFMGEGTAAGESEAE